LSKYFFSLTELIFHDNLYVTRNLSKLCCNYLLKSTRNKKTVAKLADRQSLLQGDAVEFPPGEGLILR